MKKMICGVLPYYKTVYLFLIAYFYELHQFNLKLIYFLKWRFVELFGHIAKLMNYFNADKRVFYNKL